MIPHGQGSHRYPQFLPDGRHFIYWSGFEEVFVGDLDSKEAKFLARSDTAAVYAPTGHLIYRKEGQTVVQVLDTESFDLRGEAVPLEENVGTSDSEGLLLSFSTNRTWVSYPIEFGTGDKRQLLWFDRTGRRTGSVGQPGDVDPALSLDGTTVAFARLDPRFKNRFDIWTWNEERQQANRLVDDPSNTAIPIWAPDGSKLVFGAVRDFGVTDLYQIPANGGKDERLYSSGLIKYPTDWFGKYIAFHTSNGPTRHDVWVLPTDGNREPIPVVQTDFNDNEGHFSPDGKWMVYSSNWTGQYEIRVRNFPEGSVDFQISEEGGMLPRWSHHSFEIFFIEPSTRRLMFVPVRLGEKFVPGKPQVLFPLNIIDSPFPLDRIFVLSADGQRFLVDTIIEPMKPQPFTVITNWSPSVSRPKG